jgi:hypothetical protein
VYPAALPVCIRSLHDFDTTSVPCSLRAAQSKWGAGARSTAGLAGVLRTRAPSQPVAARLRHPVLLTAAQAGAATGTALLAAALL